MSALPAKVHTEVAARIFRSLREIGWASMSLADRSAQYSDWLRDPEIGGRLTAFMAADKARVWIKDGPVKEYPRALAGVGRYAPLVGEAVDNRFDKIVAAALDASWDPDLSSIQTKPLRLIARRREDECVVAWGPARDLKHLVWAALSAHAAQDHRPWVLVVIAGVAQPVSAAEKSRIARIAERIGCSVRFLDSL